MKEKTEEIRQILAVNIKKRREILGISQEELAESANLSVQAINTIEGCRMWISDKSITRIAKALELEVFQLFVPYHVNQNETQTGFTTSSSILLELRKNILNDTVLFSTCIDNRIKEILKSPHFIEPQIEKKPLKKSDNKRVR
ncbi:MAG: helix-turn-helix transcriptional regulator [Treponema sp.]|nr:helix-turn-helix transcriptional regulator [Treponema sp.]MCL2252004.1 helix-turn-helix transcriptional regulator [Treponema sp.]